MDVSTVKTHRYKILSFYAINSSNSIQNGVDFHNSMQNENKKHKRKLSGLKSRDSKNDYKMEPNFFVCLIINTAGIKK